LGFDENIRIRRGKLKVVLKCLKNWDDILKVAIIIIIFVFNLVFVI